MSLTETVKVALPSSTLRSYAMIGIVLYAFGVLLNEIGNNLTQFWLVPYADTISALGFVIALYTASLTGVGTRLMVLIGIVYGLGTFYVSEPPATYAASGLQIGTYNTTHTIGLALIGFALIFLIALAFYFTRVKRAHTPPQKMDPGSTN
ncbi:MAG TPA: hypothetical protein VE955_12565 [Candidatus Dormibacteraeota bacterium]|jgi:hypothetical protein|nr:hypothetical protein [Candidatus Dormibacteraeota bacterium]